MQSLLFLGVVITPVENRDDVIKIVASAKTVEVGGGGAVTEFKSTCMDDPTPTPMHVLLNSIAAAPGPRANKPSTRGVDILLNHHLPSRPQSSTDLNSAINALPSV